VAVWNGTMRTRRAESSDCRGRCWPLYHALLALGCFGALAVGCGGEGGARECIPDDTLLETPRLCAIDDDCPCGSSCQFGTCAYECRSDQDCASGHCDAFGRCRDDASNATVAPAIVVPDPTLRTSADFLLLTDEHLTHTVAIAQDAESTLTVRVAGEPGLDVSCDGVSFEQDCFLDVPSGTDASFQVRANEDAIDGRAARVSIHPRRGAPSFVRAQLGVGDAGSLASPRTWGPLANGARLRGTARVLAAGAEGSQPVSVEGLPAVPVEMDVHPGVETQVVVIREPLGLILPQGGTLGRLRGEQITLPAWRHIPASDLTLPESEVVAQPQVRMLRLEDGVVAFELELMFGGFSEHRPYLRILFDLQRVGDAPAGPGPSVPPSYVSPFAPSRAEAPTPWESLAHARCGGAGCALAEAERFACTDDLDTLGDPAQLTDALIRTSGDVACESTGRAFALDYVLRIESSPAADRFGILNDCVSELASLGADPSSGASGACLHPLRVFGVLASTVDGVRNATSVDLQAALLAHRALQQVVELGSYIAREGQQATRFNAALGGDCGSASCPSLDELGAYLRAASRAADLLLHPRYGQLADAVAPTQPAVDYAAAAGLGVSYDGPPLAYSMMRTSVAWLELLETLLEEAHLAGADAPPEGVGVSTMRKALMLRAFASALAARAQDGAGLEGTEAEDFDAQAREFDRLFARNATRIVAMRRGENALGIDEGSVPLYLDRDVESPEARAFALTNYLLDPSGDNWIGRAIEHAEEAQRSARDAWATRLLLDTQELQIAQDLATHREAVKRDYGQQIASLCPVDGLTDVELLDALARGELELDPDTCFIDTTNPDCADFAPPRQVEPYQVVVDVCMAATLRRSSARAGFPEDPEHDAYLATIAGELESLRATRSPEGFVLSTASTTHTLPEAALARISFGVPTQPPAQAIDGFADFMPRTEEPSTVEDLDAFSALTAARARCEQIADANVGGTPPVAPQAPEALDRAECYRGGLGMAALATRAAFTDLEAARARLEEHYERYRIAVGTCTLQSQAQGLFADETRRFESEVAGLNKDINNLGMAADAFGGITNAASAAGTVGAAAGPYAAAAVAVTSLAATGLTMAADELQKEVDAKQEAHDGYMMAIQRELDLRLCMNEASKEMVGLRTASLEIQRASQELASTLLELQNLKRELATLVRSGVGALSDDVGPQPYAGMLWLDESLRLFETRMRLARRVTFLAAMAVDYERQECNADGFRDRILAAHTPAELSMVRDEMLASTANRQIGDGTVGDAFVVLSLRDDIFQLSDRRDAPEGEAKLSPSERLRLILTDPRYAVYDDGRYLGQRIPFELLPPQEEPLGYSVGHGYFAQNHCAERVWSVNVGIAGSEGITGSSTLTRVEMLKHNEFFSQWCRPRTACDNAPYQRTGIQPSTNLFLDPYADGSFLAVATSDPSPYSRVVLSNVRTDVARSDMEREDYGQGAQSGFAGRGLFGQYALFFPADAIRALCPDGRECGSSAGNALDLSRVDDIFIRFDYVAGVRP